MSRGENEAVGVIVFPFLSSLFLFIPFFFFLCLTHLLVLVHFAFSSVFCFLFLILPCPAYVNLYTGEFTHIPHYFYCYMVWESS